MENTTPTSTPPAPHKSRFSPRTVILIVILAVVALVLIFLALQMNSTTGNQPVGQQPDTGASPTSSVEKTATISFQPETLDMTSSNSATVEIIATAGNIPITGVQVSVSYDPTVIRNVRLLPADDTASLFGPASSYLNLFTESDPEEGTLTYALGIQPIGNPVVGSGSIGKLSFTVVRSVPSTQITFGDGTAVTVKNAEESVLNTTTPLTVTLQ